MNIYEVITQKDLGEKYSNGTPKFYSSKKAAVANVNQELLANQAIMITDDEYLNTDTYPNIILSKRYYCVPVDRKEFIAYRVTLKTHTCYTI